MDINLYSHYSIMERLCNELKDKEYFSTEEAMILLQLSKPTILRKFKEWQNDPDSKEGIAFEGQGGRGGFRVRRNNIQKYVEDHGISLRWDELLMNKLDTEIKNMEGDRLKKELNLLDLLIKNSQLDLEYETIASKNKEDISIQEFQKLIKIKKRILELEYEKQILSMYLD